MAASVAIFTAFPFLNTPPFNYLTNKAISWLMSQIADKLELISFYEYIDLRVDAQGKDYVQAAHDANIQQTEESLKKADDAFRAFVKFTN